MKKFGYSKNEKLKQKKDISLLLKRGRWKVSGNIRMVIFDSNEITSSKIGVSVSKKFFKHATERNRIKRLLRESYRLNKNKFITKYGKHFYVILFWYSPELPKSFSQVEKDFLKLCEVEK